MVGAGHPLGERPSHPELLDWLAAEFVEKGWSLKKLHRLIVTTAAYRRDSAADRDGAAKDPENTLLGRMNIRRMESEAVRDALLVVSGQLDGRVGGPGVFPDLPPGVDAKGGWTRSASASPDSVMRPWTTIVASADSCDGVMSPGACCRRRRLRRMTTRRRREASSAGGTE